MYIVLYLKEEIVSKIKRIWELIMIIKSITFIEQLLGASDMCFIYVCSLISTVAQQRFVSTSTEAYRCKGLLSRDVFKQR